MQAILKNDVQQPNPSRKKHPLGLYMLFATEAWERFSYYGMRAILVLYLTATVVKGGLGVDKSTAMGIYGFFTGAVYITPMIGGYLTDRFIGRRLAITIGGILMALGNFSLFASQSLTALYIGLGLLIIGNGFFKPNISTIVGDLYEDNDPRRDGAFTIFYMGINVGAFFAPLIVGLMSYKYGFLTAAIGMIVGQLVFNLLGNRYLGDIGKEPTGKPEVTAGDRVTSELRMRIISGMIESGTILSENKLAADFGVSRSPIREALKILASENIIRLERMGAVVIGLTEKEYAEIYDVRLLIETFVFERLVRMDTNELVMELSKILEMMKISIKYRDADEFSNQDVIFHETIIRSINHSYILMIWDNLKSVMESLILLSMRSRFKEKYEDFTRIINNHQLYIDAIKTKDRDLMIKSLHKNFDDVQEKVEDLWMSQQMLSKGVEQEND
ncbi:oligopeptide:H+ symporter [Peribacillus simplex]|uniref:oligopeptide:H+ symporter n=1 Tax=Peribacillus simplex TaxID=1478 RepID=UPI003D267D84